MKAQEIRELTIKELDQKLADCSDELFNLRAQGKTGQLQNNSKITQLKRDIARIKTVLVEGSYQKGTDLSEKEQSSKKEKKK